MEAGWYTLIVFAVAWFIAQSSKTALGLISGHKAGKVTNLQSAIGEFMRSGGMPSGHTASLTAAGLYLGLVYGFGSGIFALAVCVWLIVVYDATHVRYAVGEQGKALNQLLKAAKQPELPLVEGHTVLQVLVGAVIGVVVALIVFWLTKTI